MDSLSWITIVAGLLMAANMPAYVRYEPKFLVCTLLRSGLEFKGSCDIPCEVNALAVTFSGIRPNFRCSDAPRHVNATVHTSEKGSAWIGDMEGRQPEDPTRLGIMNGLGGSADFAKTPFGWFPLQSAIIQGDALVLTISVDKQVAPTHDDILIIQRATKLLADTKSWNRIDNRICPPSPQKWSLYCALMQASEEVTGGVHYRQPALQAVREVLDEVGGSRLGKHRLMDYNNHPDTTLEEIHALLHTAQEHLERELR